jgi:hypothetical protein
MIMSENPLNDFILEGIEDDRRNHQVDYMKKERKKGDPLEQGSVLNFIAREGAADQREFDIELKQNNMIMKKAKEVAEKYM